MDLLNNFYQDHVTFSYTQGPIEAKANGILINSKQLQKLHGLVMQEDFKNICALILAHEYAHILQMRDTAATFSSNGEHYQKRMLEAQADIFAGRYCAMRLLPKLTETVYDSQIQERTMNEHQQALRSSRQVSLNAMNFFFHIGAASFSAADHPTNRQRLSGIIRGQASAVPDIMDYFLLHPEALKGLTLTSDDKKMLIEEKQHVMRVLDYKKGQRFIDWSYEQAKLIVHGNPQYLCDIVKMDEDVKWNTTKAPMSCYVSLKLKNIGTRDMKGIISQHVTLEVDSLNDLNNFNLLNAVYDKIVIKAGQEKTITDTIYLKPAKLSGFTQTNMSDLLINLIPGDYSLYYFEPLDLAPAPPARNDSWLVADTNAGLNFKLLVNYVCNNIADNDIEDLVTDAGEYYSNEKSIYAKYNCLTPSWFYRKGMLTHYIKKGGKPSEVNSVKYMLGKYKDSAQAIKDLQYFSDQLKALKPESNPDYSYDDDTISEKWHVFTITDFKDHLTLRLEFKHYKDFTIELTITNEVD